MKTQSAKSNRRNGAFTLIELLVVIAIIGILAALIFPATGAMKRNATIRKAKAELKMVSLAIDSYKAKFGYYPPGNVIGPGVVNPLSTSLYFELTGVTNTTPPSPPPVPANNWFETLDGAARVSA
ncbi:MAG: prepilin-type N-terminal cleavage/methylation domain-containing protein, partial [Verrucomicrobiota bacterium]